MYIRRPLRAHFALASSLLISTIFLAGCGGGGGGGSNLSAYPVAATSARTLTGGTALERTSAEIGAELTALNRSADSLLIGDTHFFLGDGIPPARATTNCAGASCTTSVSVNGISASSTLSLANLDFTASSAREYQAVMTRNDIALAQGRARTTVGGERFDVLGYGGWLDDSFFFAYAQTQTGGALDFTVGYGLSAGNATGRNPAAAGGATWSGVMVGADVGASSRQRNPRRRHHRHRRLQQPRRRYRLHQHRRPGRRHRARRYALGRHLAARRRIRHGVGRQPNPRAILRRKRR